MSTFSWLHFTDLHWGDEDKRRLWNQIEEALFDDINKVRKKCNGKIDAVFFTGDLVNKGKEEEFLGLTNWLKKLQNYFKDNGSNPVFLFVPGNHDLEQPANDDDGLIMLSDNWSNEEVRRKIWDKKSETLCWKTIETAFKNYSKWMETVKTELWFPTEFKTGLLPGDFRAGMEINNCKIGVIGLNTAFLQLKKEEYLKKLELNIEQLVSLCGNDYHEWFKQWHMCFLLTHHSKEWLNEKGKSDFDSEIAPPSRFALHLFGHRHENEIFELAVGGSHDKRTSIQSKSLFGTTKYIVKYKGEEGEKVDRKHGYCAGLITFQDLKAKLRIWPRIGTKRDDGKWHFVKDIGKDLDDDEGTHEIIIKEFQNRSGFFFNDQSEQNNHTENDFHIDQELKEIIKEEIYNLLKFPRMSLFLEIFKEKVVGKDGKEADLRKILDIYLDLTLRECIRILRQSLKQTLQEEAMPGDLYGMKKVIWNDTTDILGWLLLASIKQNWAKQNSDLIKKLNEGGIFIDIPLGTWEGREIAFSRLLYIKAEPFRKLTFNGPGKDEAIICGKGFGSNLDIIESGWDIGSSINEIKRAIQIGLKLPKKVPVDFSKEDDIYLNTILQCRNEDKDATYIPINMENKVGLLNANEVIHRLRTDLPALNIIRISSGNDESVLVIKEPELQGLLHSFLELQP
ncbi:MAG: metallophosphoesterase family protein [Candidatus Omnitrophota bacterium]